MKKLYSLLFIFCLCFQLISCKKDISTAPDFSKITVVDDNCIYVGDVDTTDWTNDVAWTAQETLFMNFADTIVVTDTLTDFVQVSAACSNPNHGLFIVGLSTGKQCKMKLVAVNTDMHVLYYTARKFTGGPIVTAYDFRALTAFHTNANYRLYYAFYNSNDSVYYKGHGDIRIE